MPKELKWSIDKSDDRSIIDGVCCLLCLKTKDLPRAQLHTSTFILTVH